jgi:hypothetical protein
VIGLVSSVRVEVRGGHAQVTVWNRGGCAGSLTVNAHDAPELVARLFNVEPAWFVDRCTKAGILPFGDGGRAEITHDWVSGEVLTISLTREEVETALDACREYARGEINAQTASRIADRLYASGFVN